MRRGRNGRQTKKQQQLLCLLYVFVLIGGLWYKPIQVKADTFSDAVAFYNTYGTSKMVFDPGLDQKGIIYYANKGKLGTSSGGTRYGNVGWKVTVYNGAGAVIETLYIKTGGDCIVQKDDQTIDGQVYTLYACSLEKLKIKMSNATRAALRTANCSIIFDSCYVVRKNGESLGGMNTDGTMWGTVHTTYESIVSAANWSTATKNNMKSGFNKTVTGLFYQVSVEAGEGITGVSGAGKYCYGTNVTVTATVKEGYHFSHWSKKTASEEVVSDSISYSFVLYNRDISLKANSVKNTPPRILAEDLYVSLEDAKNGRITEQWIADTICATDAEDGNIAYGNYGKTSLELIDYSPSDLSSFQKAGSVTQTIRATDSAGNAVTCRIRIHVVDNRLYDKEEITGRARFISLPYYRHGDGSWVSEADGGLWKDSVWKQGEYRKILEAVLHP